MKIFKKLLLVLLIGLLLYPFITLAKAEQNLTFYFFYNNTCSDCIAEYDYLQNLEKDNPDITVKYLEVTQNQTNADLFVKVKDAFDQGNTLTPYLVIGGVSIVGYDEKNTDFDVYRAIEYYKTNDYVDVVDKIKNNLDVSDDIVILSSSTRNIPIIGEVDIKSFSLVLGAIIIGFVDGFNPCAMWILLFLMTMLISLKDRRRMWIIGLTFILTSGIVYGAIMVAWLSIAKIIAAIVWMRRVIGIVAILLGVYSAYTFFKSLKDDTGCEVTNDKRRQKLMDKIKNIVKMKSVWIAIGSVIVLATTVNLVELACSAGLPYMYTQLLAYNDLSTTKYVIYILIYIFFFLLNEIIIFVIALVSFRVAGISNKYTKYTHIIGAIIMIAMGILLIFFPKIIMFT